MTETYLTVRYAETDRMGIVHHSKYYPWFEIGRSEFTAQAGLKYSDMESMGIMMPLVETGARYLGTCTYEDEIVIRTYLKSIKAAKCEFYYEVYKKDGMTLITTGKTVHGFVDKNMRPVNMKKKYPDLYQKLESLVEEY